MERELLLVLRVCVGFISVAVSLALLFFIFPSMKSEVGAAWTGALGTVAAFGAAIYLARRGDVQRRQEPILSLGAILYQAEWLCKQIPQEAKPSVVSIRMMRSLVSPRKIETVERALDRFPLDRLLDYASIEALFQMRDAIHIAGNTIRGINMSDDDWYRDFCSTHGGRKKMLDKVELALAHLELVRAGAGING
ncbi:hypothetical protein [Herbaspirillum sp. CAH-3]|uniref:hypothetical protein n=1 Tax=Herbaspirillum sp. CAH-3 TaxID=2605746 RepID=UPI0012ACB513|nr:hypothetical protein [Herbaspirillum sp. CAH-3]MRT27604.1 hypothetical protein [Herbaspirillum sp. CAH-3]